MLSFENDIFLKNLSSKLGNYKIISFDIFDTLIFRTCYEPTDVFRLTGEKLREQNILCDIPPDAFKELRWNADINARKQKWLTHEQEEVTLDEIYAEFSELTDRTEQMKDIEEAIDKEYTYLNPNIYSFLEYCRQQDKIIVLMSDFYSSGKAVTDLLKNVGVDTNLISHIAVSSEYGVLKSSGKLFERVLELFPSVLPDEMLHIGDSLSSDIGGAEKAGVSSLYYGVIPGHITDIFQMERNQFRSIPAELHSLRKLAINSTPNKYNGDEQLWFEIGSAIFGPLYALYAEWIIELAVKRNIKMIVPFMREGELLGGLIKRAIKNRRLDIRVETIFISRRTTEIVSFDIIDEKVIRDYIYRGNLTVKGLFSIFYLDIEGTQFEDISSYTIKRCIEHQRFDRLEKYFLCKETVETINKNVGRQRELLLKYFMSIIGNEDAITVDVGFRGTMQHCLSHILKKNGYRNNIVQAVLMGIKYNAQFIIEGTQLLGWLGFCGENNDAMEKVYRRIQMPEAITNADIGTTLSYYEKGSKVLSVQEEFFVDDKEKKNKKICWEGMFFFQDYWFCLFNHKPDILNKLLNNKAGFLSILRRLLEAPTYIEAKLLGSLQYDESILNSGTRKICCEKDFDVANRFDDVEDYLLECNLPRHLMHGDRAFWPEGVAEIKHQGYFIKKYLRHYTDSLHCQIYRTFEALNISSDAKLAIYGAGDAGRIAVEMARAFQINVACIVDKNKLLHGKTIDGIEIMSSEKAFEMADAYLITSFAHKDEIESIILSAYAESQRPKIYSL